MRSVGILRQLHSRNAFKSVGVLTVYFFLLIGLISIPLSGCDTGFGEPCTFPKGDAIEQACSAPSVADGDESGATQASSATCALDNFPGCETFLCLKYRGSKPYCSLRCQDDSVCDGGFCCPLFGDCNTVQASVPEANMSQAPAANSCATGDECYCIRNADLGS